MRPIISIPFSDHVSLISQEAKNLLYNAGFDIISNDTGRPLTRDEHLEMVENSFGIIAGLEKYDSELLHRCKNLRVIVRFGVATENFDFTAIRELGIKVGIIANHNAVAEFALGLILSTMKKIPLFDKEVRETKWNRYQTQELCGKTIGILGFGRIGQRLCKLLKGFDVRVLVYDPFIPSEVIKQAGSEPVSFEELLTKSDVISIHIPANPETKKLINEDAIEKMKKGVFIINTSRASVVDEEALVNGLLNGKIAGIGVDVYEAEPIAADNPLISINNSVLTPHVASLTYETNYNGSMICAQSIINVFNGDDPVYPVK